MGTMPVAGPLTTTGLQVVDTMWAYDQLGLEPSANSALVTQFGNPPPCGELGRCLEYGCGDDEVPEVMEYGVDYDLYHGWYYFQTTATCYVEYDGSVTMSDAVNEWLGTAFCAFTDTCVDPQLEIVVA